MMVDLSHHTAAETDPPPPGVADRVRTALETAGLRLTGQRAAVFECLERQKTHPTAEDIYRQVRRQLPRISLATVYKSLEALVVAGLATKLTHGAASARYDACGPDHYHLRDTRTGEIHDLPTAFDPELLVKLDPRLIERLADRGFQVTGYRLEVLGTFAGPGDHERRGEPAPD